MSNAAASPVNYLDMTDEELLAAEAPAFVPTQNQEDKDNAANDAASEEVVAEAVAPVSKPAAEAEESDAEDTAAPAAGAEGAESEGEGDKADVKPEVGAEKVVKPTEKVEPAKEADVKAEEKPAAVNFEAEYNRLLAPFKANGREIQVKSVDDAIALMQMGANYNKKMAGLKPNLKLLKMLENNGLLDEGKLSYLIDLDKKDPDAIQKLVKDSGLDPMGFDAEKAGKYQPRVHAVDEREVELDTVLDELQGSPSYSRTLSIVSKEWDGASKQAVANSPQLLKVIHDHVERGIYDIVSKEMESERLFGRLAGLSDIEAYRQIGDAIQARGGFNHLGQAQKTTPAPAQIVQPKPKKADDEKLNEKRRAAAPTKPVAPSVTPKDFNPLALSDAEFAKLASPKFA